MVIDQGTILDRIDYNIDMVATNVEEAVKELDKVHIVLIENKQDPLLTV